MNVSSGGVTELIKLDQCENDVVRKWEGPHETLTSVKKQRGTLALALARSLDFHYESDPQNPFCEATSSSWSHIT